jgi:DNA-directed RNA polymerase specialized sigma24 family protein
MEPRASKRHEKISAVELEQLLENYYDQLLKWGAQLTRGDVGRAEDIVQDFCLYVTLAKPDLSEVKKLDAYLYTCLRHLYLSDLARSSREALHFINVAEYESIDFVFAAKQTSDPLQLQNDLRRICSYAIWRKESSKSASCFILHFFHGYFRREIGELARLPMPAIYNRLKDARGEVKSFIEVPGKLGFMSRESPPEPELSWSLVSSAEIFRELRDKILLARASDCLPHDELLAFYTAADSKPIPCALLSHIVSCERCLGIIDRYFRRPTLREREPLDGGLERVDHSITVSSREPSKRRSVMQLAHKRRNRVMEHRPSILSIAVDGKIVASHDVGANRSLLSARIDRPETVQFVEVFSEQEVRLALLPINGLPPESPYTQTQRVSLSDGRWLELNLTFDGLGLSTEVAYFDPSLGFESFEEIAEGVKSDGLAVPCGTVPTSATSLGARAQSSVARFVELFREWISIPAMAWAIPLAVLLVAVSVVEYRHTNTPLDAQAILSQSLNIETAGLRGQTEHQVLRLEEVCAEGQTLQQGTVDLWRDGDGERYLRRFYNAQHQMVAAEWRGKDGSHHSYRTNRDQDTTDIGAILTDGIWNQDVSARAFNELAKTASQLNANNGGNELTVSGPTAGLPHLISATLTLDRHRSPLREVLRIREGSEIHEIRFAQTDYERKPIRSVPDDLFMQDVQGSDASGPSDSKSFGNVQRSRFSNLGSDVQLAELQIAVLYQLNQIGADTGDPIEIVRTADRRISVSGTISDDARRRAIFSRLASLPNHQSLDVKLISPRDIHIEMPAARSSKLNSTSVFDSAQTRPLVDSKIREHFQERGLSGQELSSAISSFSRDALLHTQHALQHAYALDRLGNAISASEFRSISLLTQQQWTDMTNGHASALDSELVALHGQLTSISPPSAPLSKAVYAKIDASTQRRSRWIIRLPARRANATAYRISDYRYHQHHSSGPGTGTVAVCGGVEILTKISGVASTSGP